MEVKEKVAKETENEDVEEEEEEEEERITRTRTRTRTGRGGGRRKKEEDEEKEDEKKKSWEEPFLFQQLRTFRSDAAQRSRVQLQRLTTFVYNQSPRTRVSNLMRAFTTPSSSSS